MKLNHPSIEKIPELFTPALRFSAWLTSVTISALITVFLLVGTSAQASSLVWNGTAASTNWDIGITTDWLNGGTPSVYTDGDDLIFNDTATFFVPNLKTNVRPNSITVNAANNYTFTGSGRILGATGLAKNGTGTLIINSTNAFTGGVTINNGIVQPGNTNALGASTSVVSVNGGTLNLNGRTTMPILNYQIQGAGYTNAGAIQNFSTTASQNGNGIASMTLTGDATIGANGARWDLLGLDAPGSTGLHGNGYALTKIGAQQIFLNDGGVNTGLGDINILQGVLGFQSLPGGVGTGLGDPLKTLTTFAGATFATYRIPTGLLMSKNIVFSNAFYMNSQGSVTFTGPVTLIGTNSHINGASQRTIDQANFNGPIGGSGSWVKNDLGIDAFNGTNTYTGATLINAGTLIVGPNSSLGNSSFIQVGAAATLDASAALNGLTLGSGQMLVGSGSGGKILGKVTNGPNSTISAGNGISGLLSVGQLTMSDCTNLVALGSDPSDVTGTVNSFIHVNGDLSLSGLSTFQIARLGIFNTSNPYSVLQYDGTLNGNLTNLKAVGVNPRFSYSFLDPASTAPYLKIQISGVSQPLVWRGGTVSAPDVWDQGATNWWNTFSGQYDRFYDGDVVIFDDSAISNVVHITQPIAPVSMTFSNASAKYSLIGSSMSSILLDQEGAGVVTLALSNAPTFNSIIANNGTLIFEPQATNTWTINSPISDNGNGYGTIIKSGGNTTILTGNNLNYSGALVVTNGVLKYNNYAALGQAFATVYITNNGTLDFNDVNASLKNIAIAGSGYGGQGALNDSSTSTSAHVVVANLTLLGDATIGANGRWDFPSSNASDDGGTLNGNGYNLTKVGNGTIWISPSGGVGLGDVHVTAGTLGFSSHVTDLGVPGKTITVESNATLYLWGIQNMLDKIIVLNSSARIASGYSPTESSTNNLVGPVTLVGTNRLDLIGANLAIWNGIGGTGGFIKLGASNLCLYGANTYSGPTIINANSGAVIVGANSSLGSSSLIQVGAGSKLDISAPSIFSLGSGRILSGSGTVSGGNIIFASGSTLAVGGIANPTFNILTMNGSLSLQSGSTNYVQVNKTTTIANSKVTGLTSVTFGGTLVINTIGSALASADAIQLFSATNYSGAFDNIVPATPGANLTWDTSTLATDGTLRVAGTGINTSPTNIVSSVSGNQLTLSWPADHTGWILQAQTNNAAIGLSTNWFDVVGSTATNQLIQTINPANPSVFYRLLFHP